MRALYDAVAGALFGVGLLLSGMTRPGKVIGFLDVTGDWDPSLALVMVGALLVHGLVLWGTREEPVAWLGMPRSAPAPHGIDARLIVGSAMFGAGWGLASYCPGPAIVAAAATHSALLFGGAMALGMVLHLLLERVREARPRAIVTDPR